MIPENEILKLLQAQPGLKGREIARRLNGDKTEVNSTLWKMKNLGLTLQDNAYRWFLVEKPTSGNQQSKATLQQVTPLGRLCKYYLECLSLDDVGGISLFAQSNFSLDYVEIPTLPGVVSERILSSFEGVNELFQRLRRSADRKVPYIGYPVRLRHVKTQKWEGFKVEPVFLFGFNDETLQTGQIPESPEEAPTLNYAVIKSMAIGNESQAMEEMAKLAGELGLGEPDIPDFDEVIQRLFQIHEDWDWRETMDPNQMSKGNSLSQISMEGIYNRCIVFGCERSPFTKGLEQELAKLQSIPVDQYRGTALGTWLDRNSSGRAEQGAVSVNLLEPLPLNTEQREAIDHALNRPLTVITGPPGTGKSQVVSSLLINAAKLGKRVLFASKNNKAVDVVEARVNNLGPRPILLRLGRGEYQSKLAEYLTALLASRATDEDRYNHDEAEQRFQATVHQIRKLQDLAERAMELRNEVDALEQKIEPVRSQLGEGQFRACGEVDLRTIHGKSESLRTAVRRATRSDQEFFTRLFWFMHRVERFRGLAVASTESRTGIESLGMKQPSNPTMDSDLEMWGEFISELDSRIKSAETIATYFKKLSALSGQGRVEDLWKSISIERAKLAKESLNLWEHWLRLAPGRLSAEDRRLLGEFAAVLRLLVQSDQDNRLVGRQVFAQYFKLFPSLVSMLSCWAVTSLSTRGRVPLEPGFFDLVVIDEASQCDIASAIPLLFRAKAAVIIGDPKQLRHISAIQPRRDRELLHKHGLADGYASWAYSENSVFDLASPIAGQDDIIMLRDHHRSHADIIEFSNRHFYESRLRIATKYDRLRRPTPDEPSVRWLNIQGVVSRPGSGALNEAEAQAVVREIERLGIQNGYQGTVGVVTPFRAQANRIRDLVNSHPQAALLLRQLDLLIDTVHKFQGDERDAIIFSPVVSKNMPDGALGFLRKTGNLFNVAITRARAALIVVGDVGAAKTSGVSYLSAFAEYVDGLGKNQSPHHDPGQNLGPEYPSVAKPELVSDWERLFYRKLWEAGVRPIPQYAEEKFLLDFAVCVDGRKLNIEVDGEKYHRAWNGELLRRDQLRNMRMMELGWDVMRFWVYQLRDEMPACVERVKTWVNR